MHLKNIQYPILFLTVLLLFFACRKQTSDSDPNISKPHLITTSVQGRIVNEKKEPVQGAAVNVGSYTGITDINGYFLLENVMADANATTVHIHKDGYFEGSRTIFSQEKSVQFVQIELLPKTIGGTFMANAGGIVNLANCKLQFSPNQVLTSNNTVYSGSVNVSFAYLNPDSSNFSQIMPGDLRGISTSNKEVGLESYGMMAVEVTGAGGEKLHLDSTKSVNVTMNIPNSLLSTAPSTIPLWYFNEATGLWKEEGKATRQGNTYVGVVQHFSFWNWDVASSLVDFKATFQDSAGLPLSNLIIEVSNKAGNLRAWGYTGTDGVVTGKIPARIALKMKVYQSGPCALEVYTTEIGSFTETANLGVIKLGTKSFNQVTLTGTVTNCSGVAVGNGFVSTSVDGIKYNSAIIAGKYSFSIARCKSTAADIVLQAYDEATTKYTVKYITINSGTYTADIVACEDVINESCSLIVNGTEMLFTSPTDSIKAAKITDFGDGLELSASRRGGGPEKFWLLFRIEDSMHPLGVTVGDYLTNNFKCTTASGVSYDAGSRHSVSITITKIDDEVVEGRMNDVVSGATGGASARAILTFKASLR